MGDVVVVVSVAVAVRRGVGDTARGIAGQRARARPRAPEHDARCRDGRRRREPAVELDPKAAGRELGHGLAQRWRRRTRRKDYGLRGPGETQLETDRRLLGKRVKLLEERLLRLGRQRGVQRRARDRAGVFSVSLEGYTNAGKSTLFNALTRADAYAADQLFATLDTTSRRLRISEGVDIVVSDTVGFIRDLPHTLVAAFRATLEETVKADLLLHVVDSQSPARLEQIEQVDAVLQEIGAEEVPRILVWNKIDVAQEAGGARFTAGAERDEHDKISRIYASARTREGLGALRAALLERARMFARDRGRKPASATQA